MKKILIIALSLVMLVGAYGCSTKESETEEKLPTAIPEEYRGSYHEEIAGRAFMEVGEFGITIDWSSSAFEKAHFDMPADYDAENKRINYENSVLTTTVFESDEKSTTNEVYNDGSGYFEILEDRLVWHDSSAENEGDFVVFARNEEAAEEEQQEEAVIENPWIYTMDLDEAIAFCGIPFDPPIEQALPDGMTLVGYSANINGIISAEYSNEERVLSIRKSDIYSGQILSGDYNEYSQNWTEMLKGLALDCFGDGESINLAYCDAGNLHYSVSCSSTDPDLTEGFGITIDELNSLMNGLQ